MAQTSGKQRSWRLVASWAALGCWLLVTMVLAASPSVPNLPLYNPAEWESIHHSGMEATDRDLSHAQVTTGATCGTTWNVAWHGSSGNSVAYGNGLYVAVGSAGTIITSPNWVTQTRRASGTANDLLSITWGNGQFVAVGRKGTILSSPNGVIWTSRASGTAHDFYNVTWGNNQFVAVGDNGTILTSSNGIAWTFRTSGTTAWLSGATYGNGLFVVVGASALSLDNPSTILTSPDGAIWTPRASGTTRTLKDVTWGNNLFVAVGDNGTILYSPNGIVWTPASGATYDIDSVAWGNGLFVAAGYNTLTSPDGVTWTSRATSLNNVDWGNGLFVASEQYGIITSPNGITWTDHSMGTNGYLNGIAWGDGLFVAVGTKRSFSVILTSPDLVSWTDRTLHTASSLTDVTWGNGQFVAVGDKGTILSSPDGVTWTPRAAGTSDFQSVTWGNNLFVAVGNGTILTSPDGMAWTPQAAGTAEYLRDVTWGNGLFMVVGGNLTDAILTSPDGMAWTPRISDIDKTLWGVTWGNGLFVATASYFGELSKNSILTSTNGVTWTPHAPGIIGSFADVAWGNGLFVVVGNNFPSAILTSPDGVNWTPRDMDAGDIHGVTYGNDHFVLTAGSGLIMYSDCLTQTLKVSRTGSGTVTSSPVGINCGSDCTEKYPSGTPVFLTAQPATGYSFSNWGGDSTCTGTANPLCSVILDSDKNVTAIFVQNSYLLTITKVGNGVGTVTSTPAGINCGSDCTQPYNEGTVVTLTAAPVAGSAFLNWTGCTPLSNPKQCTVTMTAAKTVKATFARTVLTVAKSGSGAGRVSGPNINCGLDCAETYDLNTVVTLTAAAYSGSTLIGWFNCPANPTPTQCRVTMSASRAVTARFNTTTVGKTALTLYKAGVGLGTVTSTPAGINCGPTCPASVFNFTTGATVVLNAVETTGSTFTGWSGCTVNPANRRQCTVVLNTGKVVNATFARPVLTVRKVGSGLVVNRPDGIFCGTDCTEPYNLNTVATLIAIPATGYRFNGWSGCTADPGFPQMCTVRMNQSTTATASFIR